MTTTVYQLHSDAFKDRCTTQTVTETHRVLITRSQYEGERVEHENKSRLYMLS